MFPPSTYKHCNLYQISFTGPLAEDIESDAEDSEDESDEDQSECGFNHQGPSTREESLLSTGAESIEGLSNAARHEIAGRPDTYK